MQATNPAGRAPRLGEVAQEAPRTAKMDAEQEAAASKIAAAKKGKQARQEAQEKTDEITAFERRREPVALFVS